jgi:three-Cys-motif partner protein
MARKTLLNRPIAPDPCPHLAIERGPEERGVGSWVPTQKHRLLTEYLFATSGAWKKWPSRVFIDPFSGPGRVQVAGETVTRDGGAVIAWRALAEKQVPFTKMLVGDLAADRSHACESRLRALGAPVVSYTGPAIDTIKEMVAAVPRGSLAMAYVDPYNLELLAFSLLEEVAKLKKVDLAINFSTMDLQRNIEIEFDSERARFDAVAPGWQEDPAVRSASGRNFKLAFFNYWCNLIRALGFDYSKEMPLITNNRGHGIYRIVFFARHDLPTRIWADVARGPNRQLFAD